jgi:shikimate dehydrogenase
MYPDTGVSPVDLNLFPCLRGVLDVVYNPARTQFLLDAEAADKGIHYRNGLLMLVAQAKEAAEWFTGDCISDDVIEPIMEKLEAQMQNIVLIGMPGCGKSTIGKLLSEKTGRIFIDADEQIIHKAGKSIPEIFANDGEEVFREWETKALVELGKQSGLIIATGGGCVTRGRNYNLLHQNGTIFWIRRKLEDLPTEGRPLSEQTDLREMYRIREPLYDSWKDRYIDNFGTPEDAANGILAALEV